MAGRSWPLNSQIYYRQPPVALTNFAIVIIFPSDFCMLPALLCICTGNTQKRAGLLKKQAMEARSVISFLMPLACTWRSVGFRSSCMPAIQLLEPRTRGQVAIALAVATGVCGLGKVELRAYTRSGIRRTAKCKQAA